jgi:hypothetical protein
MLCATVERDIRYSGATNTAGSIHLAVTLELYDLNNGRALLDETAKRDNVFGPGRPVEQGDMLRTAISQVLGTQVVR